MQYSLSLRKQLFLLLTTALIFNVSAQQTIVINPSITFQTIEGIGASDCWDIQFVGKYWSDLVKGQVTQYLFDKGFNANHNPNGIGLSLWRFNLGGGSAEQGDAGTSIPADRRAECFLDENGNYDWSKQSGEQWFLDKAKSFGCESFVAFSNTPLVRYTRNGEGYASGDRKANIRPDKYGEFASYMVNVAKYFEKKKGIRFKYISPVNEPQNGWSAKLQEGSPWQNNEIKKLVLALDSCITKSKLTTKILIPEATQWDVLYKDSTSSTEWARNQIYQFFDKKSKNYIGNVKNLEPALASHSYWLDRTNSEIASVRQNAYQKAVKYKIKLHQTEWCMLSTPKPGDQIDGFPATLGAATYTDIALFMAKVIHSDLVYANVSSWSYWTAVDKERWSSRNQYYLIRLNPTGGVNQSIITSPGTVDATKTLWALGNYSLFIRPGYKRIQIQGAGDLNNLMGSAYISPDTSRIVVVYLNMSYTDFPFKVKFLEIPGHVVKTNSVYRTDSKFDLANMRIDSIYSQQNVFTIPQRSVVTFVYDLEKENVAVISKKNGIAIKSF